MTHVDFYFTFGCPWNYLASVRLHETVMRTGARIVWKPVLAERLVHSAPRRGAPVPGSAPAHYEARDLTDWARFCGVRIGRAGPFPVPAGAACRGAIAADKARLTAPYSERVFVACFEQSADIDAMSTLVEIAAALGMDTRTFATSAQDPATLQELERNTDELLARGGFATPSLFVGEHLYVGNARMPLVELALRQAAEQPLIVPGAHGQV